MSKTNFKEKHEDVDNEVRNESANATNLQNEQSKATEESAVADNVAEGSCDHKELEELQKKYAELNDAHLRLMAEFDNYRKRTLREKTDLIKSGGESVITNLLPVVDDIERALQNIRVAESIEAVTEGVELIYNKFNAYLTRQHVKPIETVGLPFDAETSEAVAMVPSPDSEMKGKVLDCVQTGYMLHDKVIRHAKVVVGD